MPEHMSLRQVDGSSSLSFPCGELPADDAILATDHEPNGYFWEGVAEFLAPDLVADIELDSEGSMFRAHGELARLQRLQQVLAPYLDDPGRIRQVITDAEAAGFEFDD